MARTKEAEPIVLILQAIMLVLTFDPISHNASSFSRAGAINQMGEGGGIQTEW